MIWYLLMFGLLFVRTAQTIVCKIYNERANEIKCASALFNFILSVAALIGWGILYGLTFSFESSVFWYALLYGFLYFLGTIGFMYALDYGPLFLSNLFVSLSSIGTVIWGFVFWKEKINFVVVSALLLVILSVFCCLYQKTDNKKTTFSWKWLFYVLLAFIGNVGLSVLTKEQQLRYNGQHGTMMMFFGMIIVVLVCGFMFFKEKKQYKDSRVKVIETTKKQGVFPLLAGACNFLYNFVVLVLVTTEISSNLLFPFLGVGTLIMVTLSSRILFKEKITALQWFGIVAGITAVFLLSL